MKAYVQFTRNGQEILGSDGVSPLDVRLSLDRMVLQCDSWLEDRKATGYRIVRSTRFVDTDDPNNKPRIVYEKERL